MCKSLLTNEYIPTINSHCYLDCDVTDSFVNANSNLITPGKYVSVPLLKGPSCKSVPQFSSL